ncbi:MAG: KilA-N domain-containing protein [Saprospiraceae bacterium]
MKKKTILVNGQEVRILKNGEEDYFCLSDIAKSGKGRSADFIKNYLRNKNTIEFLGLWETLNNKNFNVVEFDHVKIKTGLNNFSISASEWIKQTNAKGIISEIGKYGGVYAHKDITIHFTTWFSVPFYLYLIKEFQYLSEGKKKNLQWHLEKITTNIDEARNLLDTIPMQKDKLNRIKNKED